MAVLDTGDQFGQLWALIQELSEQLNQNRSISVSLHAQAGNIKTQAVHSQTGFVLRRFNLDRTQEEYDAELERINASMVAENQSLQYDNKQLGALIKEYEQTLETLMSNFRNRAQDVQERELSLIREYETKLLARQESHAAQDLLTSTSVSESLVRISHLFRQYLRSLGGEDVEPAASPFVNDENHEPWATSAASEHALEREIELARLERENDELRRMLGLVSAQPRRSSSDNRLPLEPSAGAESQRTSSMTKVDPSGGDIGPFGTYKRIRLTD